MVGMELGGLSKEELSEVIESGLFGLFGLVGSENGVTPAPVTVEGRVSFGFFGNVLLEVSRVGREEGTFGVVPFSFRVLSLLFWRGVNLASSLSDLPWGVGTGGVFGGWSLSCLGGSPSVGSEGFVKPQNDSGRRDSSSSGLNNNSNRDRNFSNRNQSGISNGNRKPFGNRGQNNGNFGGYQRGRGRGRGRFDTNPNVGRPRVASKTVNKDKGRCFYSNEFGHFIKECSKKTEDARSRRYSRMDSDYQQEGQYSDYDDTGLFTDDYDDEVFATLNS